MIKKALFLTICGVLASVTASTYKNPVLTMDFSDPDVCAGPDGKFYMTASSFGGLPGLPILVSEDLVNWSYAGYALNKHPFPTEAPEHGNAVWAPSIRYRKDRGEYVIYWGDPDRGIYRVSAKDPAGPWSEPRLVKKAYGIIDVCPLYDDDGRVYLIHAWANSRAKLNSVLSVCELDADETAPLEEDTLVYDGVPEGNFTTEGPKFYKKDGEYWVMFPAGGVGTGWQVAMRSKSPYGPYETRTVLAQGRTKINGPHQGGWVRNAAGEDWFLHFSDRDAYGRIVHLEPMKWREDGWPVIGVDEDGDGCGEPVEEYAMPASASGSDKGQWQYPQLDDEFNTNALGLQWQWLGKSYQQVGFPTTQGFFRLYTTPIVGVWESASSVSSSISSLASGPFRGFGRVSSGPNTWNTPNILVQKFPAFAFTATMKAQVGAKQDSEEAGIIVQGMSYARLGLKSRGDHFDVVFTECVRADKGNPETATVIDTVAAGIIGAGIRTAKVHDVWLRVDVEPGEIPAKGLGPLAVCTFSYSFDGETWKVAPKKFIAEQGKWIGATLGMYAVSAPECKDRGWLDADWFRVVRK